jgi:predicted phage baseplate assembly protein
MQQLTCGDSRRRADARAHGLNGIDSVTVSDDQRTLAVVLFGKAPPGLTAANFRIDGGRQVTVTGVQPCPEQDPDLPDCLQLSVDRPGDFSCYRLCVVATDPSGQPGSEPYDGFDVRSFCADFSFKQNCSSLGDCAPQCAAAGAGALEPVIDYLARDYASLRQALLDRLSLTLPDWTERHLPDIGITLVELLSYAGDQLNYRLDAVGTEAYLDTARLRTSVRRHARLVDYRMHDGCAARAYVCLTASGTMTMPAGDFRFSAGTEIFEPLVAEDVTLYEPHNQIDLWTWGDSDCCLEAGATSATLMDEGLQITAGDLLVFEEICGAVTGLAADADRTHRQVVRLTSVTPGRDVLYDQALLQVAWDRADALTFPLCVRARGGPDCTDLVVGVARGNVVLVEHGASNDWCGGTPEADSNWPSAPPTAAGCPSRCIWGCPVDGPVDVPGYPPVRFRPSITVGRSPVTQHVIFPEPHRVAEAQAAALAGISARARDRIGAMTGQGALSSDDLAYLTTLFGADVLARYPLGGNPAAALRLLLGRFDLLLAGKLARLEDLCHRARAGYVLTADDQGQEIDWAWGTGAGQVIDPARAALRGPAAAALRPDPRDALPEVRVTFGLDTTNIWLPRRDLLGCGPTDRCFVGETDDDQVLTLRFGDGRNGLAPPPGVTPTLYSRTGNGAEGNVGAEAIDTVSFCATHGSTITAVRNPLPAAGGTDPEPVAIVRQRAPRAFGQDLRRAITAADYAEIAGRPSGVQRAGAQLRWTGSWYEAQVAIDALGAEAAPRWLLDDERHLLDRYRRVGHDVRVVAAVTVPVEMMLCVQVQPDYIAGHVRSAVLQLLGAGVRPDGTLGMFHPDNLTFGTSIRVSVIVAAVAAVPGVTGVAVTVLKRQFAPDEGAAAAGVLAFAPDEIPQLDNDPAHPDHGLLTLTIGGGR